MACAASAWSQVDVLGEKQAEVATLTSTAREVSRKLGEVALSGAAITGKDALAELKKLVAELELVNERLSRVETELAAMKANRPAPKAPAMADEKVFKPSAYFQFQFRDSDEPGAEQHAWALRRARIGGTYTIDSRSSAKMSFDAAAGTNQASFELKDVILSYKLTTEGPSTMLRAGQFPLPLGYEIERSSSVREMPERSKANRTLFNGERVRGAMVEHAIGGGVTAYAGLVNSLTVKDKESNTASSTVGEQAGLAGLRYAGDNVTAGLGYMAGKRPAFTGTSGTSPEIDRHFLVADAGITKIAGTGAYARAEALVGKDRLASSSGGAGLVAKDMNSYHLLVGYEFNARNQLFGRYGTFDPDEDTAGNLFKEYGVGYRYLLSPGSMLTLTWEVNEDPTKTPKRFNIGTLRYQVKF